MSWFEKKLKEPSTWKGLVSIIAAIVMFYTPDHIDRVIELLLVTFGIPMILMEEK